MGEVAERSEVGGGTHFFSGKWVFQNICFANILAPSAPAGHPPLINEGGKFWGSLTVWNHIKNACRKFCGRHFVF